MKFRDDLVTLLKARNTLIMVTSKEEARAERIIMEAAGAAKYPVRMWDCWTGFQTSEGDVIEYIPDPTEALKYVGNSTERYLYIFRDLDSWFDPVVFRGLKSLSIDLQVAKPKEGRVIVLLGSPDKVPKQLSTATVLDLPLPDREEVKQLLADTMEAAPEQVSKINGTEEIAIDSALGLMSHKIADCFSRSLVSRKSIDPRLILETKKKVISDSGLASIYEPDPRGLDAVGGYDLMKMWLTIRRQAFSQKARDFGLPAPKGLVLVGVPGCGKSLTAKCAAASWQVPLLKGDTNALKSKFVGESEANVREFFKIAEAVAPCVLWFDEIEKMLGGATGPQGDGGVSSDALGVILNWMQEKTAPVFVIATANQVESLPPELLRKGRFDEMFFVDLPNLTERKAIVEVTLIQNKRGPEVADINANEIAIATDGFTGAEIAALIPEALFTAFNEDGRELTTEDVLNAAKDVVPLSKTASSKIEALREWAKGRARPSSSSDASSKTKKRVLDID